MLVTTKISGCQLGSPNSSSMNYFFKLSSYLAKGHNLNRFGSQSGHKQIRSSNLSSSNWDNNLVVVDAFS